MAVHVREKVAFGPHYAVDWLARCAADRAHRESLRNFFRIAVVALSLALSIPVSTLHCDCQLRYSYLLDDLNLPIKSRRSALNQWYICCQAHTVHMASGVKVIQSVKNDIKVREPVDIKPAVFDVCMVGL
jgi:hypothetical protein